MLIHRFSHRRDRRHPYDRGWLTQWEIEQISYWTRGTARRRHRAPFSKTPRGMARRAARLAVLQERRTVVVKEYDDGWYPLNT